MSARKQINQKLDEFIMDDTDQIEVTIIDEYRQLSEKCDLVIAKIKSRKLKKCIIEVK